MHNLTSADFEKTVKSGVTLVDFNADWCGPCKMQAPVLEELAAETSDKYTFASVDVDAEPDLAREFSVSSIPCLVIMRDGVEKKRLIGLQPKKSVLKALEKVAK